MEDWMYGVRIVLPVQSVNVMHEAMHTVCVRDDASGQRREVRCRDFAPS